MILDAALAQVGKAPTGTARSDPVRAAWVRALLQAAFAGLGIAAILPIILQFYWPSSGGLDVTGHPIGRDFINNWVGPRLAFGGELAILTDLKAYAEAIGRVFGTPLPFHNWSYPPFALLMLWPFAQLPYFWALGAWTILLFAAFAAVTLSRVAPPERLKALLLLLVAPACLINIVGGQNGFLTGSLLLGGLLTLDRRPWLAGVLFGLLTYKPHLGLALPFVLLALGAWRTIASACLTALALVAVSAAVFGLEPWYEHLTTVRSFLLMILVRFEGFFPYMMASVYAGARTVGLPNQAAWAIQAAVSAPVLIATIWAVRRTTDPGQRTTIVVCAVPLLTPYAFNYDLTAVAAVIVWRLVALEPCPIQLDRRPALSSCCDALPDAEPASTSTGSALAPDAATPKLLAAWLIPVAMMPLNMLGIGIAPVALLALYLTVLAEIAREAAGPAACPAPAH